MKVFLYIPVNDIRLDHIPNELKKENKVCLTYTFLSKLEEATAMWNDMSYFVSWFQNCAA